VIQTKVTLADTCANALISFYWLWRSRASYAGYADCDPETWTFMENPPHAVAQVFLHPN